MRRRLSLRLQQLESRSVPATITINTVADNTTVDGKASLREALLSANGNANFNADVVAVGGYGTDNIVFDAAFFGVPQTIKLLTVLPDISGSVNFQGTSAANVTVTRDAAAPNFRLFNCAVLGTGNVSFSNMTITGASAGAATGAGIAAGDDNLKISNCVISNNTTTGSGGGIHVASGGTITVNNTTFSGNSSLRGGAIYFFNFGNLVMDNCTISGNKATGTNGGGGFYHYSNTATIRNSTISGNSATTSVGGAMTLKNNAMVTIQNSTIANNSASTTGGGIHRALGTLSIESTIVAKNTATTGRDINGTVSFAEFNLIGEIDGSTGITDPSNITGTKASPVDPMLGSLANNGGLTQTHALLAGSKAINAGSNPLDLTTDQRGIGFVRSVGKEDIGAFELQHDFVVTNTGDAGAGSLRQAIINANANPGADSISFDASVFSSSQTITLTTGQLSISEAVAINGTGASLVTVSGNNASRVFSTAAAPTGALITLFGLTITGGEVGIFSSGAGIFVNDESLSLSNCVITGNNSSFGSAGGIQLYSAAASLTLTGCTISMNTASGSGGGILIGGNSNVVITDSAISGNTAGGSGGGIWFSFGGSLLMERSTVDGNKANSGSGGGIYAFGSAFIGTIRNCTVSSNSVLGGGQNGGGIVLISGAQMILQNSTVAFNSATGSGGGISVISGTLKLDSTVVGKNTCAGSPDIKNAVTANSSFIGDTTGAVVTGTPLTGDPMLGPLANNGGTTQTHHPNPGSPLIGAGSNPASLTTDQRGFGFTRANDAVDIGAVEVQSGNFIVTNANDSGTGSLRQCILNSNGNPGTDAITFDSAFFNTPRTIALTSGDLDMADSVTITGPGAHLATISGNNASRVINIFNGTGMIDVTLSGLTLMKGNAPGATGGAIRSYGENLTVQQCIITSNAAAFEGGILVTSPGKLLLTDSQVTNNTASTNIGGVASTGAATILRSTISGNSAADYFGGLFVGGTLTLEDSTISDNTAGISGGGLHLHGSATSTIRNSTISGNTAATNGGGILLGASYPFNGTLLIHSSTITSNTATSGTGGGITRIIGTGTITLESTIVSGNSNASAPDISSTGTVNLKTSLVGSAVGFSKTDLGGNLPFGTSAKLGPLTDNGGPTLTHALLPGSPAIDKGSNPAALSTDQRGFARVYGTSADIGAFEVVHTKVTNISRVTAVLSNAASVQWNATFDHVITGLSAGNFYLTGTGSIGAIITSVIDFNGLWTITAATGGDGSLGLTMTNSTGTYDGAGNPVGFLPFVGDSYTIDRTAPIATAITRIGTDSTNAATVQWAITFSEAVANVGTANFTLINGGLGGGPAIDSVSGTGATRIVTASTGSGSGTLGLNLTTDGSIMDAAGNVLTGLPVTGEVLNIDRTAPNVVITANPVFLNDFKTGANALIITATFNETMNAAIPPIFDFPVENPSPSLDFASGNWISNLVYEAKFNVFDANVKLADIDVRVTGGQDAAGNSHGQTTAVDLIDLETQNPLVEQITRGDPSPTNLATVKWTVKFAEAVTGVSAPNFALFNGGLGGSVAITDVTGSGTSWTVMASTGTGEGTLGLYVVNSAGVTDAAGNPLAALPIVGPAYAIDHVMPQAAKVMTNTLTIADANVGLAGFTVTVQFNELMNQLVNPIVTFPTENPMPTLNSLSGVWLDAKTYRASYTVDDLGIELSDIDVMIDGAQDVVGNPQSPLAINDLFDIDTKNPKAESIQVNDGSIQRSMVTSLTVKFSEVVTLTGTAEGAFSLIGPNGAALLAVDVSGSSPTQTIAKLTFSGPSTEFSSLKDGKYTLTVLVNQVADSTGNAMGNNGVLQFHRLFGDADGNATVNSTDFAVFRTFFGLGSSIFDFNNDGQSNSNDFAEFRKRFGITLAP